MTRPFNTEAEYLAHQAKVAASRKRVAPTSTPAAAFPTVVRDGGNDVGAGPLVYSSLGTMLSKNAGRYKNERWYCDRIIFDSRGEYERYLELRHCAERGELAGLVVHPVFPLLAAGSLEPVGSYTADFRYLKPKTVLLGQTRWLEVVEDIKNKHNAELRAYKRNLLHVKAQYGIDVVTIIR